MDKRITKKELSSYLEIAKTAAKEAGTFLTRNISKDVLQDWGKDIKLKADKDTHATIVEFLKNNSLFPILSEEDDNPDLRKSSLQWIIDPLDGSLNFSRSIPLSAVSIALAYKERPILGVVYDFYREEMFSGIVSVGAWKNGKKVNVSSTTTLNHAVLMTGFPSDTDYSKKGLDRYIYSVQAFKKIRLIGSAALSLAYVACGRADAYFENGIKLWDIAAGMALVEAAGGRVGVKLIGKDCGAVILASNGSLKLQWQNMLKNDNLESI